MAYDHTTIKCPHCQRANSGVVETRSHKNVVYRRRCCRACHERFTTTEHVVGTVGIKAMIKAADAEGGVRPS